MGMAAAVYTGEYKSLAEHVSEHLRLNEITIQELASKINYSRSTLSRYLNGKYDSDASEIEDKLKKYLGDGEYKVAPEFKKKEFYVSDDAKSIVGVCSSCQQYVGLGIVVGKSGYGKTHTLKHYAKMPRVAYIECDDTMGARDLIEAIERALGIPNGYGSIWKRINGIRDFCNTNKGYLIIIDEADKLISKYTQKKMEILRGIFDQSDVGMVIAGEPRLEAQIKSYLARFENRIDFFVSLHGLSKAEVESFLEGYDITEDALTELKIRACNAQTGCFRLLDRTLNNVIRILEETGETTVTLKIIEQASNMMML